jgi:hypothetical protein
LDDEFRQGDVLLRKVDRIPKDAVVKEKGAVILAYGETTGHKHVIQQATLLIKKGVVGDEFSSALQDESYLQVEKPTQLVHDEHGAIDVPAGNYLVIRQREYTPQSPRLIAD